MTVSGVGLSSGAGARLVLLAAQDAAAGAVTAAARASAATCDSLTGAADGLTLTCTLPVTTAAGMYTVRRCRLTLSSPR